MVVCENYRVIFFHIPKTGGSSVRTILLNDLNGDKIGVHVNVRNALRKNYNLDAYIKFSVIRNPYSRMVSWYHHLLRESEIGKRSSDVIKPESFEQFIKEQTRIYSNKETTQFKLWSLQKDFISYGEKVMIDYIIRFENFQNDFDLFSQKAFGKTFTLPHMKNWGVGNDYRKFYTDELQEIVYNKLKGDFEYFGYKKDFN